MDSPGMSMKSEKMGARVDFSDFTATPGASGTVTACVVPSTPPFCRDPSAEDRDFIPACRHRGDGGPDSGSACRPLRRRVDLYGHRQYSVRQGLPGPHL